MSEQAGIRSSATVAQLQLQIIIVIAVVVITIFITYFALTRIIRYQRDKKQEFLRMEIQLPDDEEEGQDS